MSVLIYKDNIVEQIGGKAHFDYVVMNYCESIRGDPSLNIFFAHLDLNGLMELQMEFLNAALLESQDTETILGRLTVKYQMLWKMGMDETHFDKLKTHFVIALAESWADESLTQVAEKHYNILRPLFQQSVKFQSSIPRVLSAPRKSLRSLNGATAPQRTS